MSKIFQFEICCLRIISILFLCQIKDRVANTCTKYKFLVGILMTRAWSSHVAGLGPESKWCLNKNRYVNFLEQLGIKRKLLRTAFNNFWHHIHYNLVYISPTSGHISFIYYPNYCCHKSLILLLNDVSLAFVSPTIS